MATRALAEARKRHRVAGNAANTFTVIGLLVLPQSTSSMSALGQPGSVQHAHERAHEIRERHLLAVAQSGANAEGDIIRGTAPLDSARCQFGQRGIKRLGERALYRLNFHKR
jgi:hypothetical protein